MPQPDAPKSARARRPRRWILAAFVASALTIIVSVGVAVGAGSTEPNPSPPATYANEQPVAQAASAGMRAAFGLLRRDGTGTDALPASTGQQLASSYSVKVMGLNVDLARRADTEAGAAWVAPGNGSTCLVINVRPVRAAATRLNDSAASCAPEDLAVAGKLVMSIQYNADKPAHEFIAGLVPDGVDAAAVRLSDGSTQTLVVHNNVYTGEYDGVKADTVTFTNPSGDPVVVKP